MVLHNREIILNIFSDKRDLKCVLDTLDKLPKISETYILHSDQGVVYTAYSYHIKAKGKAIRRVCTD